MITSKSLAEILLALVGTAGCLAWIIMVVAVLSRAPDRGWLAAALERVDNRLFDRINTLLFLEKRRADPRTENFSLRIARQTQGVLAQTASPSPFPAVRAFSAFGLFAGVLAATLIFYLAGSPWQRLVAADQAGKAARAAQETEPLELTLPTTNNVEHNLGWGEVRITDPGADLKVTKVDVVPLQIEAAANQPLKSVDWFSTINGTVDNHHELPAPNEPRYAVYQPVMYLDELQLSDWDVLTYYAKADTEQQNSFASEVYFLEVRPFREDILKLPGGENGGAYRCLNELSALINRQQHVIRQTHQHAQRPPPQETLEAQDRKKLYEAETDLAAATQHLYAKMASTMENRPIGDALDNLAKAEESLQSASKQLAQNVMDQAQQGERTALSDLVAARKAFQNALSENPEAFEEPEQPETVDPSSLLKEMAEFRNESKATQDFVRKALEQQKQLEQQARSNPRTDYPRLAQQQRQLEQSLQQFENQHPQVFKPAQTESQAAHEAMNKSADALQKRNADAKTAAKQATQQLEALDQSLQKQASGQQLADAYKLKELLDQQIATLGKCASSPTNISPAQLQQTASASRQTVQQLKNAAEQEPTRDAFEQPLRDALNGANKVDIDAKLGQLQQAQTDPARQEKAAQAKDALSKVSQAFEQSEPKASQLARKTDSLKTSEQESFNTGIAELESLINQLENNRKLSPEDKAKQGRQALFNLQTGLRAEYGSNERGNQILLQLDKLLKPETPLEVGNLKKLMEELKHFSVETADQLAKDMEQPQVTNIDPARLPPAYRGRIQKYFQKLSEK